MDIKSSKSTIKRVPKRGKYDLKDIYEVLDAYFICHVGFVYDDYPVVIPTIYGRKGDILYFHGATKSRMLQVMESGVQVSVAVTLLDGIVMARSAFHHSLNYRSAVIFGKARKVDNEAEKLSALEVISNQIAPGRWEEARLPNKKELKATSVLFLKIEEGSAKVRQGPAVDEPADYELDIWAGVIPVQLKSGLPIRDELLKEGIKAGDSIEKVRRRFPN